MKSPSNGPAVPHGIYHDSTSVRDAITQLHAAKAAAAYVGCQLCVIQIANVLIAVVDHIYPFTACAHIDDVTA